MGKTSIPWTERTWNPVRGCSRVSPGCVSCYAERMAARFSGTGPMRAAGARGNDPFAGFAITTPSGPRWTGKVELIEHMLDVPLKRKQSTTYFVNSMSDLFHEALPDEAIDRVFAVMALCPQHIFQVLTKRAERMAKYVHDRPNSMEIYRLAMGTHILARRKGVFGESHRFPLPNIWLGVSVEDQQRADERIPLLLQTPAAVRFLSVEPLLGPTDLRLDDYVTGTGGERRHLIHWVIVGGESGPGARPCDISWIRSIVGQCKAAGVPCFVKQLGANPRISRDIWHNDQSVKATDDQNGPTVRLLLKDRKAGEPTEWPNGLRVRQMPEVKR